MLLFNIFKPNLKRLFFFKIFVFVFQTQQINSFDEIIGRYRFQANLHLNFNPHEEISQFKKALLLDRDLTPTLLAGELNFVLTTIGKFKKVQAKKLVKLNKSKLFFREISFLSVLNFVPVQKLIFVHF